MMVAEISDNEAENSDTLSLYNIDIADVIINHKTSGHTTLSEFNCVVIS